MAFFHLSCLVSSRPRLLGPSGTLRVCSATLGSTSELYVTALSTGVAGGPRRA